MKSKFNVIQITSFHKTQHDIENAERTLLKQISFSVQGEL